MSPAIRVKRPASYGGLYSDPVWRPGLRVSPVKLMPHPRPEKAANRMLKS